MHGTTRRGLVARMAATAIGTAAMLASVAVAVILPAGPASADTFGGCYGPQNAEGCVPDNYNHWYCFSGTVNANLQTAINGAMATLDNQTRYTDFFETAGCNNLTDVMWQQNTAIAPRGDYQCLAFNSLGDCERALLRLNPNQLTDNQNRRKTACHELGHSGGLRHGGNTDCMRNGVVGAGQQWITYSSHHVTHLDNRA